jgi:hypothetical protein
MSEELLWPFIEKPRDTNIAPDTVVDEEEVEDAAVFKIVSKNDSKGVIESKAERVVFISSDDILEFSQSSLKISCRAFQIFLFLFLLFSRNDAIISSFFVSIPIPFCHFRPRAPAATILSSIN